MIIIEKGLLDRLGSKLIENGQTISVAESVTSGMLQAALSFGEQASKYYEGGITAYNIDQKCEHLRVERSHAAKVNCVSQRVADEMAAHVAELFRSNWGVAVTGYATPVPESGHELFAYYSISFNSKIVSQGRISSNEGQADIVQQAYSEYILKKLHNLLMEQHSSRK